MTDASCIMHWERIRRKTVLPVLCKCLTMNGNLGLAAQLNGNTNIRLILMMNLNGDLAFSLTIRVVVSGMQGMIW